MARLEIVVARKRRPDSGAGTGRPVATGGAWALFGSAVAGLLLVGAMVAALLLGYVLFGVLVLVLSVAVIAAYLRSTLQRFRRGG